VVAGWAVAALAAVLAALPPDGAAEPAATDYDRERAALAQRIGELEAAAGEPEGDATAAGRLAVQRYRYATLSGDFTELRAAEEAIEHALATVGPAPDLVLLRAQLHAALHRLPRARQDLARLADPADLRARALAADLDLQEGRYRAARRGYEEALRRERSWDLLARLAFLGAKTGDAAGADRLYAEAQEQLTAKEMRPYAWLELQRGVLDLERGDAAAALGRFERADRTYSGYWLIEEHLAEALHLLGRTDEAVARYRRVVARAPRPELLSALAGVLAPRDPAAAAALDAEAARRFDTQYALYPEAAVGHLVEHRLRRGEVDARLLGLAEANHRLRPGAEAKLLLARVHLALGQRAPARSLIDAVLATPWKTAELDRLARGVRASQARGR
jgi:tetratricopeptide (TPR) repeat protein